MRRWFSTTLMGGLVPPIVFFVASVGCERRPVGASQQPGPAIARVNGLTLYKRDFEAVLPEDYQSVLTAQEKREYLDRWIATQLLYEHAERSGIGVSPEIQSRLELYKKDLVADRLVQEVIKEEAVVTDAEVRAYFESHQTEYTREVRVSHILVNTLEDVAEVKELLKKHTFSWVARRRSIDRHTGVGGDLGFLSMGNMVPEFEAGIFDMEIGDVSDVIETEFGYHFIMLTDIREARNKLEYQDVAEEISRMLLLEKRATVFDRLQESLRASADVEILDAELRLVESVAEDSSEVVTP